jgi:hypothetical protein
MAIKTKQQLRKTIKAYVAKQKAESIQREMRAMDDKSIKEVSIGKRPRALGVYAGNSPRKVQAGFITPFGGYHYERKKK